MLELERMAAEHWRGTEEEWLGEWLLRAADGFTGRANSALPLGNPGLPLDEALGYLTGWYRARGLPPVMAVPLPLLPDADAPAVGAPAADAPVADAPVADAPAADAAAADRPAGGLDAELAGRGWVTRPGPAFVMVADLPLAVPVGALPDGAVVAADAEPDPGWIAAYHYRGTDQQPPVLRQVLTSAREQAFISIRAESGVLAIARLSIAGGWAGLTAVEVDPAHRRAGLGLAITAAACAEAVGRGVGRVFLQVAVDNAGARALYERCGFRYSHRYHYRVAPAAGAFSLS
jgi:GNAT superfamily N-acetyltransferase